MYRNAFAFTTVDTHARVATDTLQTITVPSGSNMMLMQAEGQTIRYTINSASPTATFGFRLQPADGVLRVDLTSGAVVRFISETAGASLNYNFCKSES